MLYILSGANEDDTAWAYMVATSQQELLNDVKEFYAGRVLHGLFGEGIKICEQPGHVLDEALSGHTDWQERDALCKMLTSHKDWSPGRHLLTNIAPHWRQWILSIS